MAFDINKQAISDFLPIPDTLAPVTDPDRMETATSLQQKPTDSHALATADHDEKGAAQQGHSREGKDLGWTEDVDNIPNPLVGGMPNDELWVLVRRFNKQMYHVKEYPYPLPGKLDLSIADEEEFSPDKLRANIERLYMTVIIGLMGFGKHIMRLRSWRETRRTTYFCVAYFVACLFDLLAPAFFAMIIALIVYPPCREMLFPPAPLALVDAKTGGVQKPKAGVLGSTDSATGAPEKHKGEAVEQEATNLVNSIATVALTSVSGKHPQNEPPHAEQGGPGDSVPDPTAMAVNASQARTKVSGGKVGAHDKTKVPMETAIWNQMRPVMHTIADISDTWERFGNALDPTPPFPRDLYRLRIAALIVPALAVSLVVTSYMLVKGITLAVGFGFFGDPVIMRGLEYLNSHFPKWQKLLELRNTVLKGVPTNAQLTVTLLRIGEANKAPLPPPPHHGAAPPEDKPVELTDDHLKAVGADIPLNATEEEIQAAIQPDPNVAHETAGTDVDASKNSKHGKRGSKILGAFKGTIKGTVDTVLGADHVKAKAGSEASKQRLGVVPSTKENKLSGPVDFKCRFHGKKGHAYITSKATIPCVGFSLDKNVTSKETGTLNDELHPVWTVAVADIKELKKIGGLGWKSKLVVGWALDREVADGLEIIDKQGNSYIITAMILREELFNRLIAMGGQKWEAW
ncbi:Succinate--hydroxymethylglutarate -transferase [Lecanosticta acicola]|uniref:Succinate--hydroxymethylglutarate -transferase n=1 Tax=Lecanosticta acicola TaxID=111012 RepID=A0AAI8YSK2_9PEZI|nr:Succinate--hydroxymethylglutarate -transferase [Lecanosticta acicola]